MKHVRRGPGTIAERAPLPVEGDATWSGSFAYSDWATRGEPIPH